MQLKKSRRRFLREKPSGSSEKEDNEDIPAQIVDSAANPSAVKVEKIGDSTPLQDFEAMMSRRDSPEWISKAINGMKNKIFDLVENSCDGDNYPKALEYLLALRKGCIIEQVSHSLHLSLRTSFSCSRIKPLMFSAGTEAIQRFPPPSL